MEHIQRQHMQMWGEALPVDYSGRHIDTVGKNEPYTAEGFCEEVRRSEKHQGKDQHHAVVPVKEGGGERINLGSW